MRNLVIVCTSIVAGFVPGCGKKGPTPGPAPLRAPHAEHTMHAKHTEHTEHTEHAVHNEHAVHSRGHAHGGAHANHHGGGHDHAAMAMPEMRLSETVEGTITPFATLAAGAPRRLSFAYRHKADGKALTDFEVVHDKRLHVFVVSEDMSFFDHVHPEPSDAAAGTWTLEETFPAPGTYHIYSDFRSTSAGAGVTRTDLVVPGTAPVPAPLTIDHAMRKTFGDLSWSLALTPHHLTSGDAVLEYTISDASGAPVDDLQPYLGAFGHLFILKDDKVTMAHAHPRGPEPTPGMRGGPSVSFHTRLPSAGRYKLWAQVRRGDRIVTSDWTVEVQ